MRNIDLQINNKQMEEKSHSELICSLLILDCTPYSLPTLTRKLARMYLTTQYDFLPSYNLCHSTEP